MNITDWKLEELEMHLKVEKTGRNAGKEKNWHLWAGKEY